MTENMTAPGGGQSDYLDFELEIGPGQGREYPVAVVRSPEGEAHDTMLFPYDELALESRLKDVQIALLRSGSERRTAPSREEQNVQSFGQALFDALLIGDIRSCYDMSRRTARRQGKGLRLKLRIQAPALAALPWEFLYDAREAEYLCLMRGRPVVRYLELTQPIQPLNVTPPLRILAMIASPSDLPKLDVEREKVRIEQATAPWPPLTRSSSLGWKARPGEICSAPCARVLGTSSISSGMAASIGNATRASSSWLMRTAKRCRCLRPNWVASWPTMTRCAWCC